jgi:hypothetical protein
MTNKKAVEPPFTEIEIQLVEQLRQHPEMLPRIKSILELANSTDGPFKTADQVESLLIEAVRDLGKTTMEEWAKQAEQRVGQEFQAREPKGGVRKKKR